MRHILTSDHFTRDFLDRMYNLTNKIRDRRKTPEGALWLKQQFPHKRALLYFTQPSTRTRLSF